MIDPARSRRRAMRRRALCRLAAPVVALPLVAGTAAGLGCGGGKQAASDVRVIAHGEKVDLAPHLAPGKHTVIDFYAVWCPPCRKLSPALERLAERFPDRLAIRKVDIVDWTMPVATQHGIVELPYLMLFDERGSRIAAGDEVFDALRQLFGDAAGEVSDFAGLTEEPPNTM